MDGPVVITARRKLRRWQMRYGILYAGHLKYRVLHSEANPRVPVGFTIFGRSYLLMPLHTWAEHRWRKR